MINPLKSEEDAFRFTLIVVALLAPVVIVAIAFNTGVALGVAGGLALGLVVGLFILKRDEPGSKAELRPRPADGTHRILVVANETLSGLSLRKEISGRSHGDRTELRVVCPALNSKIKHWTNEEDEARANAQQRLVCPALNSKIKHWTNEEDEARANAQQRLEHLLAELRGKGFEAEGDIGDDDPVQAMEDALRRFPADEVIISTHPAGRSNWLEHDVVNRAQDRFDLPVTHVVVDLDREQQAV